MATINGTLPPSLQPWPRDDNEDQSLKYILGRVQAERGHFRNVTEESLEKEMADGTTSTTTTDEEEDEDEDSKEPDTKTRREELWIARNEMLQQVSYVSQRAIVADHHAH